MKTPITKISDGPGFKARAAVREAAAEVYGAEAKVLAAARAQWRGNRPTGEALDELHAATLDLVLADRKLKNLRRRAKRWEGKP